MGNLSNVPGQLGFTFEEAKPAQRRIWKVSELAAELRSEVERAFSDLWIEGEISDLRPAASGHIYFTLKDDAAQLSVVLFRSQARLLRFRPEDGLHILLRGRLSVYEQRGQMQIVAEHIEPMGAGSLQLAFEQVKRQLQREGLFDSERKQPLPAFPRCVGIVTSPSGAVIRDFVNIVTRRHSAPADARLSRTGAGRLGDDSRSRPASPGSTAHAKSMSSSSPAEADRSKISRPSTANRWPAPSPPRRSPSSPPSGTKPTSPSPTSSPTCALPLPQPQAELITAAQHKVEERLQELRAAPGPRDTLRPDAGARALPASFCHRGLLRACATT